MVTTAIYLSQLIKNLSWNCHICKRERPDEKISVFLKTDELPGFNQHIRYCNDNPTCKEKAKEFSFFK